MRNNPLQFAVVREDPLIEAEIIERYNVSNLLMVCSGGCTLLSLQALFPRLDMTAFDLNSHQINHTQEKLNKVHYSDKRSADFNKLFNIEEPSSEGLNQCGNFESLFRGLRKFIYDFILSKEGIQDLFLSTETMKKKQDLLTRHRYWSVAFSLFFSDPLLRVMFGDAAIQHAPKGSYAKYFQGVFEKALQRENAVTNYFLHHVFLGYYLNDLASLPLYLQLPLTKTEPKFHLGELQTITNVQQFQLIQLSNLMDWMSEQENRAIAKFINQNTAKGSLVLLRQLNNHENLARYFPDFSLEEDLSEKLNGIDRSLFYSQILCLKRRV